MPLPTFKQFLFYYYFNNFLSKFIISSKSKTLKGEYLNKMVRIILALYKADKSYTQIIN